jgi:hypothetical protein
MDLWVIACVTLIKLRFQKLLAWKKLNPYMMVGGNTMCVTKSIANKTKQQ